MHPILQRRTIITLILLVLLAIMVFFKTIFGIGSNERAYYMAAIVGIYAIIQFRASDEPVTLYRSDVIWGLLVLFTMFSSLWALNGMYALYGGFATLILYLCYRVFMQVEWDEKNQMYFHNTVLFSLVVTLGIILYGVGGKIFPVWISPNSRFVGENFLWKHFGVNYHYLGSVVVLLLPYILFKKQKASTVRNAIWLAISFYLIYQTGSAFVVLNLALLIFIYVLYRFQVSLRQSALIALVPFAIGLMLFIMQQSGIINLRRSSFVIREFFTQDDRFLMWNRATKLFIESPLVGQGRYNWVLASSKYGYGDYRKFRRQDTDTRTFNQPHSSFFQVLSELGIIGIILYLLLGFVSAINSFRQRNKAPPFEIAALVSLLLYFILSLMYGAVYNFFHFFKGAPVLAVFALAILDKQHRKKLLVLQNNKVYYVCLFVLSMAGFYFFFKVDQSLGYYWKAKSFENKKHYELSAHYYEKALPFWNTVDAYIGHGKTLLKEGKPGPAFISLKSATEKYPYHPEVLTLFANSLYERKQYGRARKYVMKSDSLIKGYIPNEVLLAKCKFQLNRKNKVLNEVDTLRHHLREDVIYYQQRLESQLRNEKTNQATLNNTRRNIQFYKDQVEDLDVFFEELDLE